MSKGGGRLSRLFPKLFRSDKDKTADGELKGPVCMVLFLDDTEQRVSYKNNWKGQVLFDLACDQVNVYEKDYFGLRFVDISGQTHWVDHGKSLSSQLKGSSTPHKFYFCVKFYAADPCKLKEEITRYLFFLQVKRDILQGRLPVTFDEAAELCAYAVQSELGDFDPRINTPGYVSEFNFVPNQTEEMENRIAAMHRRCVGATPLMAEHRFLEKSKWLEMYGVDLHPVQGESNMEYFLGLTPTGIVVYKHKTKVASYFWPRVTKASHKSKIFMIKVKDKNNDENVYAFELSSKSACKHLWKCCVEHHTFFRVTQAKDKETRPTKVLRSLSNSSHRGRSERQAAVVEQSGRQEPNVCRVVSRRQQRRVNSESRLNADHLYGNTEGGLITLMGQPQPVRAPRHRSLPELQGKESPRSVKSAPWESKYDYGLYTSGHESPGEHTHHSRRSRAVSGSDSESGISQRKKYFPSRKESDNESDGSASRRRRRELDSDSGSEVSFTNSGHGKRQNMGTLKDHNRNDLPILYPFHDKDKNKNGSIPSLHSAPVGEFKQQRRRRRRSKSPGNTKQFPQELKQHIEFDLVDTEGMTEDQLQDIAYTKVETKNNLFRVKYSPKFRQKIWASRRKSFGDADRPSESNSKSGGTLGRQDSRNTDPAGAYGGYTTHGGSSVDERPPPYNTVRPLSSGNPNRDSGHFNNSQADYATQSGNRRPVSQDYSTVRNDRDHRNQQQSLPQHSQAYNSSNPQYSYHNPVYFDNSNNNNNNKNNNNNSKGVSASSHNFNSSNSYHSGNQSGSEPNYNDIRSTNHSRYSHGSNNNNNSQTQRQSTGVNSRNGEYGRQTPSRNLYQDFKDSAMSGDSPSSPSRSVGVTANSSQTNTPPRSRPPSYHQHQSHHPLPPQQQSTPPRSDYARHNKNTNNNSNSNSNSGQQQQHFPPKQSQQPPGPAQYNQGHTPPRMQQQQTPMYRQQQQLTPPRSQYSPQGQLRGGSSMRGQGPDYRNSPPHDTHHQHPSQYRHPSPSPHYNSNPNPPDSGHHMRGHSGQSASSSGYSGSHSYQSTPPGFSPRQSRPGNPSSSYNSQHSNSNPQYSHRQGSNHDTMGQGQRSSQGHPPSQAYTSTPRRIYRSDLVTEL